MADEIVSPVFGRELQQREIELAIICARGNVSLIGIQRGVEGSPDLVLFQTAVPTLTIPLAEFVDPDRAVELIRAKVAQSGLPGGAE